MRKFGLSSRLLLAAGLCVVAVQPALAQSPVDPSLPNYRAEEKLSGELTLSGSYTMAQVAAVWAESFRQFHPDVTINVQIKGAVQAVNSVTSGEADFGML